MLTLSRLHKIAGCDNANRKADVVFIHGLGGDHAGTWRHGKDESTSWPHWLAADFPDVGVWSLEYAASPSKWTRLFSRNRNAGYSMSLPDRAGQVIDLLVQKHLGERPLLFICHSLGGLLAKQILRTADDAVDDSRKKQVAAQTRAVLFLATPHNGAELASLIDAFRTLFGSTVSIDDLKLHDAHLLNLYNWYRNHSPGLGIRTVTYYEKRPVKGLLSIVNATSAQPGVGVDPVPLDEDHVSIAKPRDRDEQVCNAARDLIHNYVLTARPTAPIQPSTVSVAPDRPQVIVLQPQSGSDPVRIPCQLPPKAKKLFGRQTESKKLADLLRAVENCAVVGPAGMGKTALAADAVRSVVGNAGERLASSPFPDGVVFLDLYMHHGKAEPVWNNLANALAGPSFLDNRPAAERATEACRGRRVLIIIEGGEEADGQDGRATIPDIRGVFSLENHCLLLTRNSAQADPANGVRLNEALNPDDAAGLFDSVTDGRVTGAVREQVQTLLEGHPLALTWAGGLLARGDDDPRQLAADWQSRGPNSLSDPERAERTLEWLFNRSVRGLSETARQLLAAAGLLARIPFSIDVMMAVLGNLPESIPLVRDALKTLVQSGFLQRSDEEGDHWRFAHVLGYRFARQETGSNPELRDCLGCWLNANLKSVIMESVNGERSLPLTRSLEHAAALLRADDDQRLWISLANNQLYEISERLKELGRLDLVGLVLGAVADWLARFPVAKARQPGWLSERSSLLIRRGDVLYDQGDLAEALAAYQESLAVMQRLAETNLSNTGWPRQLSVSQNRESDDQSDVAVALATHREALTGMRHLAGTDPSNRVWLRNLSGSQERIGDVLFAQGDLAGALNAFRESLAVVQHLQQADPSNADWQRDLSVSQNKVGDVLLAQGDLAGALNAFSESLTIVRYLAQADSSNAGWQRDLSVSHNKVGDVLLAQGELADALNAFRESLAVRQHLALADPSNARRRHDLSVSHIKVGDVLLAQGDLAGALDAFGQSLALMRRLAQADPSNAGWQRDLGVGHDKMGDVLRARGDLCGALNAFRESLAVRRHLAQTYPLNASWQRDLSFSLTRMAEFYETRRKQGEALLFAEESLLIDERLAALDRTNVTWQNDVRVTRALVARLQK